MGAGGISGKTEKGTTGRPPQKRGFCFGKFQPQEQHQRFKNFCTKPRLKVVVFTKLSAEPYFRDRESQWGCRPKGRVGKGKVGKGIWAAPAYEKFSCGPLYFLARRGKIKLPHCKFARLYPFALFYVSTLLVKVYLCLRVFVIGKNAFSASFTKARVCCELIVW